MNVFSDSTPSAERPEQPSEQPTHLVHYLLGEADVVTRRRWLRWTATAQFDWHGTVRVARAWTEVGAVVRLSRELPR